MILRRRRPKAFYAGHVVIKSDKTWHINMRRREINRQLTCMKAGTVLGDGGSLGRWLRGAGLPVSVNFDGGECLIMPSGRRSGFRAEGRLIVGILRRHFAVHRNLPVRWTWEIRLND